MSRINGIRNIVLAIHYLITLHETFNDLMLYKDVSELTDLCFKHNNVCSTTFEDFNTLLYMYMCLYFVTSKML